jgi:hypothetical protein
VSVDPAYDVSKLRFQSLVALFVAAFAALVVHYTPTDGSEGMVYLPRRASRVIAGSAFARRQAGRKVRTPWSSRLRLRTQVFWRTAPQTKGQRAW